MMENEPFCCLLSEEEDAVYWGRMAEGEEKGTEGDGEEGEGKKGEERGGGVEELREKHGKEKVFWMDKIMALEQENAELKKKMAAGN